MYRVVFLFNLKGDRMTLLKKICFCSCILIGHLSISAAEFESNMALSSDYIWRGMTQTSEEAAISGGFDIANENGIFFGTWASNVEFGDNAATELDWYAGYSNELETGLSYDIGYLSYTYPGENSLDFEEIYLGLNYSFFGVTYSLGQDDAPDNLETSFALGDSGLNLTFGDYENFGKYTMLSYDLPVTLAGLNVSLGLSDFSADSNSGLADEDTLVFTFSK